MAISLTSLLPAALRRPALAAVMGLGAAFGLAPTSAFAICNVDYVVQPGDNLFSIADKHYGDRNRWTLIYYRNQDKLAGPSAVPGRSLHIPCPPNEVEADATPLLKETADLKLLTGDHYEPFVGRNLPGQGMVTELVNAALELAPSPVSYAITWEDDWGKHYSMISGKETDMGFPWAKPDCEADPTNARCVNFHFTDPIVSVPMMFFSKVNGGMSYQTDADVLGKTICVPAGFYSGDLDSPERRWVRDSKITLVQPGGGAASCLHAVARGEADAALLNLFVGAETLLLEDLRDQVQPLEKPFSEIGLHVIISKTHWRGTSHLYRVNAGLKKLRESGRFDEIMARHLELFWGKLQ
ncbi:Bacterial extracellular solute-binding proteins, family 3 [Tritonibacter multivorans]|uniref:Bacterial extracellular solute-binding proteins, family 3 n=1 Tax=Tritonibacter multivorans TaxID=928856 RepID=A0A0P1GPT9_9RHOB|nr:transporter substrate-binding domain-containing protein [Tritonibacter multivorans]MDA7422268.1 transporter substrate-binding domain-containing protein [Tritonibacter multivorans]CUH77787.1 Bacterial extracellular solute-binding proteins, family 3 [Tritonibacter multivorans]SFD11668.1 amino acid ABC transporter substrate-binding protein, PAAT family (TC 3.A.1.3.-) [Tritonibacter multivorans]